MRRVREAAKAKESAKGNEAVKEAAIDKEARLGRNREETSKGLEGRTAPSLRAFADTRDADGGGGGDRACLGTLLVDLPGGPP